MDKSCIIGIDEVGRGCLAGPVVAAGVIMQESVLSTLSVDDSKKLTAAKRQRLAQKIIQSADAWSIGVSSVEEIDRINILQASLLAMRRTVQFSVVRPDQAWVDGREDPGLAIKTRTVINGDAIIPLISCASIVAKVFRDSLMAVYACQYQGYGLDRHMGYGTAAHLRAIDVLGVTKIHRRHFKPIAERIKQASAVR